MNYIQKNFHDLFNAANEMNCTYQKPAQCPHCGICCDPLILGSTFILAFYSKTAAVCVFNLPMYRL